MPLVVQKYGGSSLADADSIKRVARRIVDTRKAGNQVCVVVSAMGDTPTTCSIWPGPSPRRRPSANWTCC